VLAVLLLGQLVSKKLTGDAWRAQLEQALLLAMGRLPIDEIDPADRADFWRALGR
jgi:hypothetical protein